MSWSLQAFFIRRYDLVENQDVSGPGAKPGVKGQDARLIGIVAAKCRVPWNLSFLTCVNTFNSRRP